MGVYKYGICTKWIEEKCMQVFNAKKTDQQVLFLASVSCHYVKQLVTSNFGIDLRAYILYIYVYASRANWGSTAYTLHKCVSCTKTLSRHWRMNFQHAVQHSRNISLVSLHTNKPAGTHGLTPTPAYFDIVPACTIRTKSQKNMLIRICGHWKHSHHICVNSECLCSNAISWYEQ